MDLEVALVVELEQRWTVGVVVFEVEVMGFGLDGGVAALLAYVDLVPSLFVVVVVLDAVYFEAV